MKIGLALPQRGEQAQPDTISAFARQADQAGFDSLWVHERLFHPLNTPSPLGPNRDLSPLEMLSFAAGVTENIKLGSSVIIVGYHRPLMLAKEAATLDVLSGGRAILGVGLGLDPEEYVQSEAPYNKRGARSADFIKALMACWKPDPVSYEGDFFTIPPSSTRPKPLQRNAQGEAHIPVIGGFSSQPGQKRTAELCDAWQTAARDLESATEAHRQANKWATEEFGRDPLPCVWRVWATPKLPGIPAPPVIKPRDPNRIVPQWYGGIEDMIPLVKAARDTGVDHIIMDSNRFGGDEGKDLWPRLVDFLAPLVDVAHGRD